MGTGLLFLDLSPLYLTKLSFFYLFNNYIKYQNIRRFNMELYIIIALFIVYIITSITLSSHHSRKIWTLAFISTFFLTSISIFLIRGNTQDVMLSTNEFNWYYFVYLFGMIAIALGIINLWIYRKQLWDIFFDKNEK